MILDQLDHPIVQAPMAGGPSTPALAAAVSEAGGLGFLAAGYRSPEAMRDDIAEARSATEAPFGANLFVPGSPDVDEAALRAYVEELGPEAGEPRFDDDGWEQKLAFLRDDPVAVVSFTFGCPSPAILVSLRVPGTAGGGTVTGPAAG